MSSACKQLAPRQEFYEQARLQQQELIARICRPVCKGRAKAVDVKWLAHVAQDLEQRHIGHGLARTARKDNVRPREPERLRTLENVERRFGQGHDVCLAPLHVLGRHIPHS